MQKLGQIVKRKQRDVCRGLQVLSAAVPGKLLTLGYTQGLCPLHALCVASSSGHQGNATLDNSSSPNSSWIPNSGSSFFDDYLLNN